MNTTAPVRFINHLADTNAMPCDWADVAPLMTHGFSHYESLNPQLQQYLRDELRFLTHTARGLVAGGKLSSGVAQFIRDVDSGGCLDHPEALNTELERPAGYPSEHLSFNGAMTYLEKLIGPFRRKSEYMDIFTEHALRFATEQFFIPSLLDRQLLGSVYRSVGTGYGQPVAHREMVFSDSREGRARAIGRVRGVLQSTFQSRPTGEWNGSLRREGYIFTLQAEDNVWLGLFHFLSVIGDRGRDALILWNYDSTTDSLPHETELRQLGHIPFDYRWPAEEVIEHAAQRLREDPSLSLLAVANGTDGGEVLIKPVQSHAADIARRSGRATVPVYMQGANIPVNQKGEPALPTEPRYIVGEPLSPALSTKAIQRGTEEFIKTVGRPLLAGALEEAGLSRFLP